MYVLRRTVGTGITIRTKDVAITIILSELDFLGGCAIVKIERDNGEEVKEEDMGAGEVWRLHPDVLLQLLRISIATHEGTPARIAEFGITAPREIAIVRAELDK